MLASWRSQSTLTSKLIAFLCAYLFSIMKFNISHALLFFLTISYRGETPVQVRELNYENGRRTSN